jgi:hypothetical protein
MEEVSIVLGLLILVTIIIMCSRSQATESCNQQVRYFDKMYYDLPKLHTITNHCDGLNDKTVVFRKIPVLNANTDLQASRWLGSQDSQPINDGFNIRRGTNIDIAVEPMHLQSGIKNINKVNSTFTNRLGHSTEVDGFADDEQYDPGFSYNTKFNFKQDDVNDDLIRLYDAKKKPTQINTVDNRFNVANTEFDIADAGFNVADAGFNVADTGFFMQ